MSITSFAHGQVSKAGMRFNTANDWNTTDIEAALGAGDRIEHLLSGMPRTGTTSDTNDSAPGTFALRRSGVKMMEKITGPTQILAGYNNNAVRFLAAWHGAEALTTLAAGAYKHVFTPDPHQRGNAYTLGWTENLMPHVIPHAKCESFEFSVDQGKRAVLAVTHVGKKELTSGAGVNTLSSMNSNLTFPAAPATPYLIFSAAQAVVRINAFTGDALAPADAIYGTGITVRGKRTYKQYTTNRNSPWIDEIVSGDWGEITGELRMPVEVATTHRGWMVNATQLKMDVTFTGSAIGATGFNYSWKFEYPLIVTQTEGLADLKTPDILEYSLPFKAELADTAPTGMTLLIPNVAVQDATAATHMTNGA